MIDGKQIIILNLLATGGHSNIENIVEDIDMSLGRLMYGNKVENKCSFTSRSFCHF